MFYYELHAHTNVGSACGRVEPEDYIQFYKEKGYSGMVITDHFYYGNTAVDRKLEWWDFIDKYCEGYRRAKAEGDKQDFSVFFGFEQKFSNGNDEYIVLGLTPEWLMAHPEIRDMKRKDFFGYVRQGGGYVIQAHPFRIRDYISDIRLAGDLVDAVEVYNAANSLETCRQAYEYAKNLGLSMVGGSDIHSLSWGGDFSGVSVPRKLNNVNELIEMISKGEAEILPKGKLEEIKETPLEKPELTVYKADGNELKETEDYFYKSQNI